MQTYYPLLKALHVTFVLLSLAGFIFRGVMMWRNSSWLSHPLTRRLPHINDSLLLLFGLLLLWNGPWSLAASGWLQLKLLLLLVYIGLGFLSLHRSRFSCRVRAMAWFSAIVVFLCMIGLAYYKPF